MVARAWNASFHSAAKTAMMMQSTSNQIDVLTSEIGYRLRRDIRWHSQKNESALSPVWIAEDPLTRRLFRCGDREHQLLCWLDDQSTFASLITQFNSRFAPQSIDESGIRALIAKCNQSGMLRSTNVHRSKTNELIDFWPHRIESVHSLSIPSALPSDTSLGTSSNWIVAGSRWLASIIGKFMHTQVSLGSPDKWFVHIAPRMGWLYSGAAICFWLSMLVTVLILIGMRFDDFWSELPDFQALRSPAFLVGFGVVFVVTRFFHEFGHAVFCKRAGAACKDAGLIGSFGLLCPYVDITDSWRIGRKGIRIAIALAGIYTECVIAVFAALVWLSTHPGWVHDLAMQTLLVCTVTTLLFNANPLMKYDGYFVLCDLLNSQNLREKSFKTFDSLLDGNMRREPLGKTVFHVLYFLGSTINRVVLLIGLTTMVYCVASQWQLAGLGIALIVLYACCSAVTTMATWTFTSGESRGSRSLSRRAVWLGWIAVSCMVSWAVNIPLPNRVFTNGEIHLGDRQAVYTNATGRINRAMNASAQVFVEKDGMILELANRTIQRKVFELEAREKAIASQIETLERLAFFDNDSSNQIAAMVLEREKVTSQLKQTRIELAQLIVTSPASGRFETAIANSAESLDSPLDSALNIRDSRLSEKSTSWISVQSIGRRVDKGTLLGWVVQDPEAMIDCTLTEEQLVGVTNDTQVRVCLAQLPLKLFTGSVIGISKTGKSVQSLADDAELGKLRRMTYQVRVKLHGVGNGMLYSEGVADVVFVRPAQSIMKIAMDVWMRESKVR